MKFVFKIIIVAVILFIIAFVAFILVFGDSTNRTKFRIFSADRKQCVSIITVGRTRYIINGRHSSVPKSNYIKLDIRKITSLGDEIAVCWNNGKYKWEIVNDKAKIVEVKLDTSKYKFNTNWEMDESGIPNARKYRKSNCGTLGLLNMMTYDGRIIIEN